MIVFLILISKTIQETFLHSTTFDPAVSVHTWTHIDICALCDELIEKY